MHVGLHGGTGDWDVAVFDAGGRLVAADASPDAQESANGWATRAGTLHVQACRRTAASAAAVPACLTLARIAPGAVAAAKADPPQLVSVITPGRRAERKLQTLGLDLSEHAGRRSTGVVLHGAQDAETLREAGFRWRVLDADLVASSRADRAADRRFAARAAASAVPSGRTSYRTLADYDAGARLGFRRFARRKVRIDVFQVSSGRRIVEERLIRRFKARSRAVRWNGAGARGDGLYFVRYRMKTRTGKRSETRRLVLELRSAKLARGDYKVRITVGRGKGRLRATLTSRRL